MFGNLRFLYNFCTIITVAFIINVNVFTIEIIASDSAWQNVQAKNDPESISIQQSQTSPHTFYSTPSLTPSVKVSSPSIGQSQQNFRYIVSIIPAAIQNTPVNTNLTPPSNLTPNESPAQFVVPTQNQISVSASVQSQTPLQTQSQTQSQTPPQTSIQSNNVTKNPNNVLTNIPQPNPANSANPINSINPANPINPTNPANLANPELNPVPLPVPDSIPLSAPQPTNPVPLPPSIPETGTTNPFQFRELDGSTGLIPRNISSLPTGIQVIGIMILNDQKSIAAIRIPKLNMPQRAVSSALSADVFYVHEGDIIEIPTTNISSTRTNPSTRGQINPSPEVLFLVVEKITSQHVEVRSRSNIADKHILR
ncbi:MAG: hypothetical protein LBE18_02665 [Planctomycetaceae bacterium]|jgi:hypothetical protein|nr:hypothetical protein [Planctomycetaceae bacterium]